MVAKTVMLQPAVMAETPIPQSTVMSQSKMVARAAMVQSTLMAKTVWTQSTLMAEAPIPESTVPTETAMPDVAAVLAERGRGESDGEDHSDNRGRGHEAPTYQRSSVGSGNPSWLRRTHNRQP